MYDSIVVCCIYIFKDLARNPVLVPVHHWYFTTGILQVLYRYFEIVIGLVSILVFT